MAPPLVLLLDPLLPRLPLLPLMLPPTAGFYVNATSGPWAEHFQMYDYVTKELPALVGSEVEGADVSNAGITGHSMGGHGALTLALKNPQQYKSVSAFSPIVSPTTCPWGKKAFEGYLGSVEAGKAHDACELVKGGAGKGLHILVDQGEAVSAVVLVVLVLLLLVLLLLVQLLLVLLVLLLLGADDLCLQDNFLTGDVNQLQPALLQEACAAAGVELTLRMQPGYDHSYYFIASFIEDHIKHHAGILKA